MQWALFAAVAGLSSPRTACWEAPKRLRGAEEKYWGGDGGGRGREEPPVP